MKYLQLLAAGTFAMVCLALAGDIFFSGSVYLPVEYGPGSVWGVGGFVMAVTWLSLGASAILAASMSWYPKRYYVLQYWRDIAFFVSAAGFLIATFAHMLQQTGVITK